MSINKIASLVGFAKGEPAGSGSTENTGVEATHNSNPPVSLNRIASLMQGLGYRGKVIAGDKSCWVESATLGSVFNIYAYSDTPEDPDAAARSIQFDGGWGGIKSYDARRLVMVCNRFNHEWRYAKATIAMEQDRYTLSIKLDHYCPNGLADEEFAEVADMFMRLLADLSKRTEAIPNDWLSAMAERHRAALGLMWGANPDPVSAADIFIENARAGFASSMSSMGDIYEHGARVPKSPSAAAYYFAQAAERGQPSAYYGLARVLAADLEDETILVEAAKYALLASRDLPEGKSRCMAEQLKDQIIHRLDDDAAELAIRLANDWTPLVFESGPIEDEPIHEKLQPPPSNILN